MLVNLEHSHYHGPFGFMIVEMGKTISHQWIREKHQEYLEDAEGVRGIGISNVIDAPK